jgi:uncharacterized protein YvpB
MIVKLAHRWMFLLILVLFLATPAKAQDQILPNRVVIPGVIGKAQTWSLSCESRSAVDLAAFWGVKISEKKFLKNLPYSNNPELGFVGRPNDPWGAIPPASYGVHAAPVAETLRLFGLDAQAQVGMSWESLQAEIAQGHPVIVWVIGQMQRGTPLSYQVTKGIIVRVARFEHTMILYGYEPGKVHVLDAYSGQKQIYSIKSFKSSWKVLGRMAVTVTGLLSERSAPGSSLDKPGANLSVTTH